MQAAIFLNQFLMGLKLYLRRPAALFWMMAFPVLMLIGLGTVLGGQADMGSKLVWAQSDVLSSQDRQLAAALTELGLSTEIVTPAQASLRWQAGKLPVLLETDSAGYSLRANSYLMGQAMQTVALVQQGFLMVQARDAGAVKLRRIPLLMQSPGGHHDGPYAGFLLPGLLGLNLLMLGVFSVCLTDVDLRVKGTYRRLATTPLSRHVYLGAQLLCRLVVVLVTAAILMLIGALMFGIANQGSYWSLVVLIFLGTACFASMGYVLASFASSIDAANGLANLVFLPLMLLSGVYFSLDSAPRWLQTTTDLLPLAPLLKALRAVFNDGASLASQSPSLLIMGIWTVLLFALAIRRFRWT